MQMAAAGVLAAAVVVAAAAIVGDPQSPRLALAPFLATVRALPAGAAVAAAVVAVVEAVRIDGVGVVGTSWYDAGNRRLCRSSRVGWVDADVGVRVAGALLGAHDA